MCNRSEDQAEVGPRTVISRADLVNFIRFFVRVNLAFEKGRAEDAEEASTQRKRLASSSRSGNESRRWSHLERVLDPPQFRRGTVAPDLRMIWRQDTASKKDLCSMDIVGHLHTSIVVAVLPEYPPGVRLDTTLPIGISPTGRSVGYPGPARRVQSLPVTP